MFNYFRLKPYCYFEKGKGNSCIYNLLDGKVIIINNESVSGLLEECEKNKSIKNITENEREFLTNLADLGIGDYYPRPIYIEKLSVGIPERLENRLPGNYEIPTVFLEINNKCNLHCAFCPENSDLLYRKTGCKRWNLKGECLTVQEWESVIKQIAKLSCERAFIIGGEPLLELEKLKVICSMLRENGIKEIGIYTNCVLVNEDIIEFLKKNSIGLRIQILGSNDMTYKKITGEDGLEVCVQKNLQKLYAAGISIEISYLLSKYNEDDFEEAINKYKKYATSGRVGVDYIYPIPKNDHYSLKYKERVYDKRKDLEGICLNVTKFTNAHKQHNCYANQIAITASGDVLPCIMSRAFVLGNVKNYDIVKILKNSKYEYYRSINKREIDRCKECAFKYGCFDCRALEFAATGRVLGMEFCNEDN